MKHKVFSLIGLFLGLAVVFGSQAFAQGGTWTAKAALPTARYSLSAGTVNGKLYAIGGNISTQSQADVGTNEAYDPPTPRALGGTNAAVTNGILLERTL